MITIEEKGSWQQAQKVAYDLLEEVKSHRPIEASALLQELGLLMQHLARLKAQRERNGWGDDDG